MQPLGIDAVFDGDSGKFGKDLTSVVQWAKRRWFEVTIHLPTDLASRVEAVVQSGQFASVDDAMAEAARLLLREIERMQPEEPPAGKTNSGIGSIGAMPDAADELDEIVSDAYKRREQPWRDIAIE